MRHPRTSGPAAAATVLAVTLVASGSAVAQDKAAAENTLGLEEITVTARKVEENLMEVPLAITAFSAKTIEEQGIKQLTDVMRFTPSFNFVNQQGGSGRNDRSAKALVFRGLFLGNNVGTTAGGQLFVDGAPVFGAQPPPIADVARIEVLKGPQSAYFGRSTFAGALNFIMKEPGEEFGGKISLEGIELRFARRVAQPGNADRRHARRARHDPRLQARRLLRQRRPAGRRARRADHAVVLRLDRLAPDRQPEGQVPRLRVRGR